MQAEGQLGTKLVLQNGVLEIFSNGLSAARLTPGDGHDFHRIPRKNGLALTVRMPKGSKMLAFSAEQVPAAEALLAAFEAGEPG